MPAVINPFMSSFAGLTNTYNSGTAASETVPSGATQCVITVWGGAGGGGRPDGLGNGASGAGSGGYSLLTKPVLSGEWGTTLTYTVGVGGAGRTGSTGDGGAGGVSTVTGTLNGGAISISCNPGGTGKSAGTAAGGGTASGGDTNTTGNASSATVDGNGSAGANGLNGGGTGGTGGNITPTSGGAASAPSAGGGGGGSDGGGVGANGGNGAAGRIIFAWT